MRFEIATPPQAFPRIIEAGAPPCALGPPGSGAALEIAGLPHETIALRIEHIGHHLYLVAETNDEDALAALGLASRRGPGADWAPRRFHPHGSRPGSFAARVDWRAFRLGGVVIEALTSASAQTP